MDMERAVREYRVSSERGATDRLWRVLSRLGFVEEVPEGIYSHVSNTSNWSGGLLRLTQPQLRITTELVQFCTEVEYAFNLEQLVMDPSATVRMWLYCQTATPFVKRFVTSMDAKSYEVLMRRHKHYKHNLVTCAANFWRDHAIWEIKQARINEYLGIGAVKKEAA